MSYRQYLIAWYVALNVQVSYQKVVLTDSLLQQIATAACLAHVHDSQHIATLETILSEASPIYDSEIQVTALECVQALVHT